ncbi:GNAT family N-acetyltransferase [Congregibacter litoralis]|uniref:Acetyltransferase n=1 Tax=Congregibacter litoralis KT71 TaxID=314285 RepID=A4A8U6_9GAMM|nr:GNAT family N-acetyltransferase [Congregibacter litoralis]EAQ97488.1 Acetyltransferase [Congregibacter litoralis KT71]
MLNIRKITTDDSGIILKFITELAVYEREPDAVLATEAHIQNTLFCGAPKAFGLICERQDGATPVEPIGFAIYFFNYSTWLGQHGLYLEDLYVTPEARGLGAGKLLLKSLAQIALDKDCGRYEWNVLRWNTPAIEFYEACGAKPLSEWVGYRMDRAAMEAFVDSDA